MTEPDNDDVPLDSKKKREAWSVIIAIIGVLIIGISFVWHIVRSFLGSP